MWLWMRFIGVAAPLVLLAGLAATPAHAAGYAAFIIDANTGEVLHENAADAERYPASLTKMMTLYVMFEMLKQKRMTLDTPLSVSANAAAAQPSKLGLRAGETITVRDAMRAIVTKSANDAALAIAENLGGTEAKFARYMTWKARKLGMTRTVFRNASGLPNPQQHTTARDFVKLAIRLNDDFPQYWSLFKTQYFTFRGRRYRNHNSLLFNFPGSDGLKTGYTRASGFNLVSSVRRKGKHVIGAVFGGRTGNERNARMRSLLKAALDRASPIKSRRPSGGEALVAANPAKKPKSAAVQVASAQPVPAPEPVSATQRSGLTAFLKKKLVVKGEVVTTLATAKSKPGPIKPVADNAPSADEATPVLAPAKPARPLASSANPDLAEPVAPGPYHVQLGAYDSQDAALARLAQVRSTLTQAGGATVLKGHTGVAVRYDAPDKVWYRARFAAYDRAAAQSACISLKQRNIDCLVMRAQ